MNPTTDAFQPVCCDPAAFTLMRKAADRIDTPLGLLEGAIAIAAHENPDVDVDSVKGDLMNLARQVRNRVRGPQPQALLAHLHELLFVERGLIGNSLNYHDPQNSYLPTVLESGRGLPITLSLIYKLVGDRAGLTVHGIGLPGHFCAAVELPEGLMIVDPFYGGRVLNRDEAFERMRDTYGPDVEWSDELLRPVSVRHWLTRLIQNLLHTFSERNRLSDVAAMLELELLLWPEQTHLQRDLALVLARVGHPEPASRWLVRYLQGNPEDPQHEELAQLLDALGTAGMRSAA